MCCSFNSDLALKKSTYSALIKQHPNPGKGEAGLNKGLKIILDQQSNLVSPGSIYSSTRAIRILVSDPSQFPTLRSKHLLIQNGHEHFLDVTPTSIVYNEDIASISPHKRSCFLEHERNLTFFSKYSYTR